ncbi:hypothetical protein JCM10450v2_008296 [Rhodotorula kratochvilovae]
MAFPSPAPSERTPHLVALKVLRATRPALVPSDPLAGYTEGPGDDALRALERRSVLRRNEGGEFGSRGVLSLPAAFGTIYLGETFNAILSLSNDLPTPSPPPSGTTARAPVLKVEMHTGLTAQGPTAKHLLASVEAPSGALAPGSSVETVVAHELKELGAHALVCTVTYGVDAPAEDGTTRVVSRSFRKVYKFQVNNPLSVRTKAHAPSPATPTSYLSASERSKIFLEVQVHNHCEHAMCFERMRFDPLPGFALDDANADLFDGGEALLPPGGVRQFLYILQAGEDVPYAPPGASQGLGRLDIVWRTPNGEIGRLQSSTLGRRVPQHALPAPAVGLPAVVPPPPQEQPGAPLLHPGRTRPVGESPALPSLPLSTDPYLPSADGLLFDLLVDSIVPSSSPAPAASFTPDEPFAVHFRLRVQDTAPLPPNARRRVRLAAQHVEWQPSALTTPSLAPASSAAPAAAAQASRHAHQPSISLPLPGALPSGASSAPRPSLSSASSARPSFDAPAPPPSALVTAPARPPPSLRGVLLPPPSPSALRGPGPAPSPGVVRLGAGVVDLGEVDLAGGDEGKELSWRWRFVPLASGLCRVGGVRVLLLTSEVLEGEGEARREKEGEGDGEEKAARTVLELETVAEVWVEDGWA